MFKIFRGISDFDELVFENRNKEYGAYQLRKKYVSAVFTGLIISTLIVVLIIVVPFLLSLNSKETLPERVYSVPMGGGSELLTDILYVPPPPPPPQGSPIVQEVLKYVPPVVVDSIELIEDYIASIDEILLQPITEYSDFNGTGSGFGTGTGTGNSYSYGYGFGEEDSDEALVIVEVMPEFPGGDAALYRFISRALVYPKIAQDNGIEGRVIVTFVVERDGSVSNARILRGFHPSLDNEALRVIRMLPKWNPGTQGNKPVRVQYQVPVNFSLR